MDRQEDGFTLVEVSVALGIVALVMSALAPFLVQSVGFVAYSRDREAAVRVADDAIERVRALKGSAVLAGRDPISSAAQWAAAPAAARPHLDRLTPGWDTDPLLPANAGAAAALPTAPQQRVVNNVRYTQQWFVGRCRAQGGSGAADRPCRASALADAAPARPDVTMYEIVVAVTWPHRSCPAGRCAYVTSTLLSNAGDPVFTVTGGS